MLAVQVCCARHCELPLSKMGNKGLFPGVAVPLAFFCTLFFRHRKKSVSAPWDGQSQSAPESARHSPPGEFLAAKLSPIDAGRGLSARPLHPFGSPPEAIERPIGLQALPSRRSRRVRPRQRGISSAKLSLVMPAGGFPFAPCTPSGSRRANGIKGFAPTDTPNGFPRGKQSARPSLSENPHRNFFPSGNPPSFPLGKPQLSPHCRTF